MHAVLLFEVFVLFHHVKDGLTFDVALHQKVLDTLRVDVGF
jgi:hypothetical protein